jgi:TLC domain-containing protein
MFDPFPFQNPPWLKSFITPYAERFNLPALPLHVHEVLFAAISYQLILTVFSPVLSSVFFGQKYHKLTPRNRFNWDVHVVSFVQSIVVCGLALYVSYKDEERNAMHWQERIYGYTGALGLVQAFACGYFVWDLYVCIRYYSLFGAGMLAHAIAALLVYSLGFVS